VIVVDAGVWARSLIDAGSEGDACRDVLTGDPDWLAPGHAPIEILRTIRRYESAGLITTADGGAFAAEVVEAAVTYVGPEPWLLRSIWRHRKNISPYDVPYVALALHHGISLVTLDVRLSRAAVTAGADVVVPGTLS
jgi:predicted nucleic acid-binding protein